MRKFILTIITVLYFFGNSLVYADNSVRTKELVDENKTLLAQVEQAQKYIQEAQIKVIGNLAVIKELQEMDKKQDETVNPPAI